VYIISSVASRHTVRLCSRRALLSLCLLLVICIAVRSVRAQDADRDSVGMQGHALDVFLGGTYSSSRLTYIKEEIPYVNYVRDVYQADLYILFTSRSSGSGDTEHTLTFLGRKAFTGVNDTLTCFCRDLDTEEQCRSEIVRIMKLGLVRYVSRTPQADGIRITHSDVTKPAEIQDRWDYWVFKVGMRGSMSGRESSDYWSLSTSVSADRVTPDLKLNFGCSYLRSERHFEYGTVDYTDITRNGSFNGLIAKSINDHWTYGLFLNGSQSIYGNIDKSLGAAPALEYNLFPYAESSHRELRFVYRAGYRYNDYEEETLYYKTEEDLYYQEFSIEFDMLVPWGDLSADLGASSYFHDLDMNMLYVDCFLSFRILEGFSVDISGSYAAIHNQIELPRRGITEEDVLLQRKELETQYSYYVALGFSYRFGSRYSNVINPRF